MLRYRYFATRPWLTRIQGPDIGGDSMSISKAPQGTLLCWHWFGAQLLSLVSPPAHRSTSLARACLVPGSPLTTHHVLA